MTVERSDDRDIVIECDFPLCRAEFRIADQVGFDHGWRDAARQGWRYKKIGRDFVHACPRHAEQIS